MLFDLLAKGLSRRVQLVPFRGWPSWSSRRTGGPLPPGGTELALVHDMAHAPWAERWVHNLCSAEQRTFEPQRACRSKGSCHLIWTNTAIDLSHMKPFCRYRYIYLILLFIIGIIDEKKSRIRSNTSNNFEEQLSKPNRNGTATITNIDLVNQPTRNPGIVSQAHLWGGNTDHQQKQWFSSRLMGLTRMKFNCSIGTANVTAISRFVPTVVRNMLVILWCRISPVSPCWCIAFWV